MELSQLFLQRYDPLCNFYLADIWQRVPHDLMIQRPHPRVNSIAWILWHMARGEDVGINRFIADNKQVLDQGNWMEHMNVPYRHHGSEMTSTEVDDFNTRINMDGLHGYILAVQARTREVVSRLTLSGMDAVMDEAYLRKIMVEEEVAHSDPEGFIQNYLPWNKGKILFTLAITHPYQHMGEIFAIATFLGVSFD
jgi:hypothetical protein